MNRLNLFIKYPPGGAFTGAPWPTDPLPKIGEWIDVMVSDILLKAAVTSVDPRSHSYQAKIEDIKTR